MDYHEAHEAATAKAKLSGCDVAIMRTVFGDFTTFLLGSNDTAERLRYEVVPAPAQRDAPAWLS